MTQRPLSVVATLLLILLSALIWLALGILIASGVHPAVPDDPAVRFGLFCGSLAAAGTLIGLAILLAKRIRRAYHLGLAALSLNALAIIFDDIGWADLIVFIINLIPLSLLIKDRSWYLRPEKQLNQSVPPE